MSRNRVAAGLLLLSLSSPTIAYAQSTDTSTAATNSCAAVNKYPPLAVRLGHEGDVVVGFTVDADGTVGNAHIIESSGYPELDEATIRGVTTCWHYRPAVKGGQPVAVERKAKIGWHLHH